jgi:hypothetical protein
MDEATRQRIAEVERSAAGAKPQPAYPTIGPMTASQRWRGETSALPKPKAPKAEDIEYGKFAKFIDIPGQFATHFANMALWGVPEMATKALAKEELPAPMTPVSKVAGAAGSLFGMGFGKNAMAASPFKVTAKVVDKLYRYVPKTIPGQIFKDAVKSAASLGLALGATEWQGGNAEEILKNKFRASVEGAETGALFFGTSFVKFGQKYPQVSRVLRFGITSALLDLKNKQSPLDERDLMQKAYDYGLNWLFTRHGQTPGEYGQREAMKREVAEETKSLNAELAKEDIDLGIDYRKALDSIIPKPGEKLSDASLAMIEMGRLGTEGVEGASTPTGIRPLALEKGYVEPPLPEPPKRIRGGAFIAQSDPDVWHDVMTVTGGKGIGTQEETAAKRVKRSPLFAERLREATEYDMLPDRLKNRTLKRDDPEYVSLDDVLTTLQKGSPDFRGNYAGMDKWDIYDQILQRPGTPGVKREQTPAELRDVQIEAGKDQNYRDILEGAMKRIPSTQFNEDEIRAAMTEWSRPAIEGTGPNEPLAIIDKFTAGTITAGQAEMAFEDGIRKYLKKLPEPEFDIGEEPPPAIAPKPRPQSAPKAEAKPIAKPLPFPEFDQAFEDIIKDPELRIPPERITSIYLNAREHFSPKAGEDPKFGLLKYVSRESGLMEKGLVDEASGKPEPRTLPIEEGVEQKSAIEGRETPEAETWQERVVGIMKKVATPDELSDMEDRMAGVPWRKLRTVEAGKYGVKKAQSQLRGMAPRASMIEKAHADPEIRKQMGERYDELNARKERNEPLSKEEMEEWAVTGAIKDGLRYMNLGPAPDIKGAEEALSKMAESMKPFVQDVASAGKESLRDKAQNLKELVRIPIRNKVTMPLAEAMVGVDNERDTATAKADRTSKPYLELQRSDKAGLAKVDAALWEGDKSHAIISDAELRSKFKLNDREIAAYKGIRTAYKLMAEYEMSKNKAGLKKVYDRLISKARSGAEQEEIEANYQEALKNVDNAYRNNPGYIPHMRTGRYAVLIKGELLRDPDQGKLGMEGEKELPKKPITAEWAWFEHESQARRHAAEYKVGQEVDFEGRRFRITEIGEPQDMSKAKLTPQGFVQAMYAFPVYEKMLEKKGAEFEDIQKLERILGEETMKYYAKGRLARRRNIAGWDKDIGKSTERFFQEFPRAVSRRYAIGDLEKMVDKLPADDRDYGRKLLNYWAGREQGQGILSGEEGKVSQGLRKFFYTWFLGLKPAFYFNNATQSLQTTLPLAQSMVGLKKAGVVWGKAMGKTGLIVKDWLAQRMKTRHVDLLDVIKNARYLSVAEKRALASVWEEGGIGASRTKEIIGGKGKLTKVMEAAGTLSEKQNRIHATLVGVAIARSKQMNTAQAIDLARRFTGKSQFVYSKANRMEAMRGAMATPLIFKSYFANYWKLQGELFKENKPAFLTSQAVLLGLAGAAGYPLAKESFDLVVHGLRAVGVLDDEENFRKQVYDIKQKIDKNTAGVVLHGLPALVDIDGDTIYGSGGIIGLAPMQVVKSVQRGVSGIVHPRGADWPERIARMSPAFIRNAIRFVQMAKDQKWPTDEYGKPRLTESYLRSLPADLEKWARENQADWPSVKDVPMLTKLLGGAGFPISPRREVQEGAYTVKSVARQVREEKGGFNREIGKLIGENIGSDRVMRQLTAKDREGHYSIGGSTFRGYYRKIKGMLPEKIRQAIDRSEAEAKERGYEINYQSILTNIRDYLEGRE